MKLVVTILLVLGFERSDDRMKRLIRLQMSRPSYRVCGS
jgi:hypothetical protein